MKLKDKIKMELNYNVTNLDKLKKRDWLELITIYLERLDRVII
jgi:hypothetical protein